MLQENILSIADPIRKFIKRTPKSLFRVSSLWFVTALIVLMALEAPAVPGRILERYGAETAAGWLGQLVMLGLLIDALRGTLPRAVALGPVVFYLSYYVVFWQQGIYVTLTSEALARNNPRAVVSFDPKLYSLVMDQADVFAATHSIPVVYARDPSYVKEGYLSYRLIEADKIKNYLRADADGVQALSIELDGSLQRNVRELRIPERPAHKIVTVRVYDDEGEGWSDWKIGSSTTSLSIDGQTVGLFKSAYVRRLSIFPFFTIGCKSFLETPTRKCEAEFATERKPIESRPASVNRSLYPDPVSIMAGIKALSRAEIAHFRNTDFGADLTMRAASDEEAAYGALENITRGRSPPLSWRTSLLIADNPSRLAPLAAAMTKRFLDLNRSDAVDVPNRIAQVRLLANGIAGLGSSEFAAVQDQLSDFARSSNTIRDDYPLLYLRLSGAGPKMYSIYRDQFLAQNTTEWQRLLAVLAICRIGQADSELISSMNSEWEKYSAGELKDINYGAALFVALIKLGQESMIRSSFRPNSRMLNGWFEAVLAGKGKTEVGPNNCMPMEWPEDTYVPAPLSPSLKWMNERWV
jgi:hypothetical protein